MFCNHNYNFHFGGRCWRRLEVTTANDLWRRWLLSLFSSGQTQAWDRTIPQNSKWKLPIQYILSERTCWWSPTNRNFREGPNGNKHFWRRGGDWYGIAYPKRHNWCILWCLDIPDKDMGFFYKKISEKNVVITPVLKTEKSLISFGYDCIALFSFCSIILHSIVKCLLKVNLTGAK